MATDIQQEQAAAVGQECILSDVLVQGGLLNIFYIVSWVHSSQAKKAPPLALKT